MSAPVIKAVGLTKTYRVSQKKEGVFGAIRGLYRREYKEVRAVDGVSFSIEPGEMVAFLGPNGAGKTTTLKMLSGLIYPTSGTAQVLGFVPWERADAFRRRFSLVMGQKNQLWWDLPAADSFQLHREIYSLPSANFEQTLDELTELFQVGALTRQPVRELSLGERMKMELIAALLHQPQLLLLDEPTIGLDVVAQATIQRCLKQYNTSRGVTMLLTSHYMRDVEALCSRVLVITHGKVIYDGGLSRIVEEFGQTKLVRAPVRRGARARRPRAVRRGRRARKAPWPSSRSNAPRGRSAGSHSRPAHGDRHERAGPAARSGDRARLRGGPCPPRSRLMPPGPQSSLSGRRGRRGVAARAPRVGQVLAISSASSLDRAHGLPRRFPAGHRPPLPADGHHHPALAGHLRGLRPAQAGRLHASRDDRLPAAGPHQPDVLQHARARAAASPATSARGPSRNT